MVIHVVLWHIDLLAIFKALENTICGLGNKVSSSSYNINKQKKKAEEWKTRKEGAWLRGLKNMEPLTQTLTPIHGVKAALWLQTHQCSYHTSVSSVWCGGLESPSHKDSVRM